MITPKIVRFVVDGKPQALKRHQTFQFDGKGRRLARPRQIDPSAGFKTLFLAQCRQLAPTTPFEVPLEIKVKCYFKWPKNCYRTGKFANHLRPDAPVFHCGVPDADNLLKFVCDALNGIFFKDDSLIAHAEVTKKYSGTERTEVEIAVLE